MERIGVAGMGRMGREIARRAAGQGAEVTGWTRSGLPADQATELGVAAARGLDALAAGSDIIILSLFDDAAVTGVLDGLFKTELSGKLIIDTSTVSPRLLRSYEGRGAALVDAPISGGPEMVANASCGVFIGGSDADAERARRAIELFSTRVFHVGPLGAGMGMKIANNALLAGVFATLTEIVQIARGAGLEFETVMRVLAGGPAGPPFLSQRMDRILGVDDSVGFPVSGTLKDVGVFAAAAAELDVEAPVLARAREVIEMAMAEGHEDHDAAVMIRAAWDRA